jgi:two-component system cell cycle sensor histidine kinase PleC
VGYGQRLRVQRTADVRVLKSQLDLIADVAHSARFAAPVWALVMAWLGSASFGYFGKQSLSIALTIPAAIAAVSFYAARLTSVYRSDTPSH